MSTYSTFLHRAKNIVVVHSLFAFLAMESIIEDINRIGSRTEVSGIFKFIYFIRKQLFCLSF